MDRYFVWYFIHFTCVLCSFIPSHSIIYWLCYMFSSLLFYVRLSFGSWIRWFGFTAIYSGFCISFGSFRSTKFWQFFFTTFIYVQNVKHVECKVIFSFRALLTIFIIIQFSVERKWFSLSSSIRNFTFSLAFLHFWLDIQHYNNMKYVWVNECILLAQLYRKYYDRRK